MVLCTNAQSSSTIFHSFVANTRHKALHQIPVLSSKNLQSSLVVIGTTRWKHEGIRSCTHHGDKAPSSTTNLRVHVTLHARITDHFPRSHILIRFIESDIDCFPEARMGGVVLPLRALAQRRGRSSSQLIAGKLFTSLVWFAHCRR